MHCRNRAQCPAYSVQDSYDAARQAPHFNPAVSTHTHSVLSQGSRSIEKTRPDHKI